MLRHFRGESSLATYLTVIARRVVVAELLKQKLSSRLDDHAASDRNGAWSAAESSSRVSDREEVERLLAELDGAEAKIVRMYHLEGKSYQEISSAVGHAREQRGPDAQPRAPQNASRCADAASWAVAAASLRASVTAARGIALARRHLHG